MDVAVLLRAATEDVAQAAAEAAPLDVVVFDADVGLVDDWLERLARASHSDDVIATASAIAWPDGDPGLIAERALGLLPRTVAPMPGVVYVRRAALELAGPLDDGFAQRCTERGLLHVVADDVLASGAPRTDAVVPVVYERDDLQRRPPGRLERSLIWTRRVLEGLDVTIDGRVLRSLQGGTELSTLALVHALARRDLRVRVLLEDDAPTAVREALGEVPTIREGEAGERTAIVHRPYQVSSARDLAILPRFGHRLVVTHLDLILYHDRVYHADEEQWARYRELTWTGLATADLVLAISDRVREDLLAEDLLPDTRVRTVHLGVDHALDAEAAVRPAGVGDAPFLVCLGSDLAHKNRPFAIRLLSELRALGWDGALVLAGPPVEHGSSRAAEEALLRTHPELPVVVLDAVTDSERHWLYREAAAVVYPSTTEGFGLVPFEAATVGTPTFVAPVSALAELIPRELAILVPWDAPASAVRALEVLRDPRPLVDGVLRAGANLTWDRTADAVAQAYDHALALPVRASAAAAFQALVAEDRRGHWEGSYWALRNEIGPTGFALVGEDGALPDDVQRALAALAGRPATQRALFALLRGANRLSQT